MHTGWISHDGSDCPAGLDKSYLVDIKSAIGSMYSIRADKVNWKNVTAWRTSHDGLSNPPKQVSDAASTALEGGKAMHNMLDKYLSVQETLNARGERYGDFTDNARISQQLKQLIMCEDDGKLREGYRRCNFVQREALEMIAQKIARILNGDPNYKDNWHDIQGYARLAEERCKEER